MPALSLASDPRYPDILRHDIAAVTISPMLHSRNDGRPDAHIRVQDVVAGVGQREHKALDQFDRKLAWVNRLFDMVVFDVRKNPNIAGIFAESDCRKTVPPSAP